MHKSYRPSQFVSFYLRPLSLSAQMVLLLQNEATSKIELETKMSALTETQLNMLTQVMSG